ncbi:hypothetical protein JCM16303_004888 [Sporobolomyces ruberrimus]
MQPYRFPRSQGSLDLTDPSLPTSNSSSSLSSQPPRPSFVITNATPQDGIPSSPTEDEHLARMTSATRTLLSHPNSSPSPQHLSIGGFSNGGSTGGGGGGKTLSRISEYSESAYSGDGSSRPNSHEPESRPLPNPSGGLTPSASTSTNDSSSGTTPTTMSFSFPTPPAHGSPPAPTVPLPQIPNQRLVDSRETMTSPSPWAYPILPGSPTRSHLPSRPITALTTPLPSSNPNPVPVPLSNFAPHESRSPPPPLRNTVHNNNESTMVQVPGRAVMASNPRASYHQSQPSDSTAWTVEGKYSTDNFHQKSPYMAYDAVSIAPSTNTNGGGGGNESNHRFTLDNNEKSPSRLGSILPVKKGANRKLWWGFAVLAVIGIAVGTGLGVGLRGMKKENQDDGVTGVDSSNSGASSDDPSQSILLPSSPTSSSSIVFSSPSNSTTSPQTTNDNNKVQEEEFSTTFGYRIGSRTTVVPLSYTIPTSYFTRDDGRIQFTQAVVLPSLEGEGSFTSDLRFRVPPTETVSSSTATATGATREKRDLQSERKGDRRRWERKTGVVRHREKKRRNHHH